jgi:hypothetical protein
MRTPPTSSLQPACYILLVLLVPGQLTAAKFPIDIALTPTKGAPARSIPLLELMQAGSVQDVGSWLVVGPYGPTQGPVDEYWDAFLSGKKDQELQSQDILKAIETVREPEEKTRGHAQGVIASGPTNQIYFDDALSLDPISLANARRATYASCEISAPKSGEFALFVRSDGAVRLWVNSFSVESSSTPTFTYWERTNSKNTRCLLLKWVLISTFACSARCSRVSGVS